MGLLDSVLSVGGSLLTGVLNNESAQDRQDAANAFSAQQYATRYQTTTKDMEAAGLNPMLAYQGISGSPPQGGIASSAGFPDFGSAFNASRQAGAAETSANASAKQADTQSRLVDETVKKVVQETENLRTDQEKARSTIDVLRQQYQNLVKEGWNLTEQGNYLRATISNLEKTGLNLGLDYIGKELSNQLSSFDVQAASKFNNLGRDFGQFKPFAELLLQIVRSFKR